MALKGIRVLELYGLAQTPFCGMLLKDFGATVTIIDRKPKHDNNVLHEGKQSLTLDLKHNTAKSILRKLCKHTDVLIDPYRPGVLERLDLGPNVLLNDNPRLIYARLTGFGQTGPLSQRPGHDINFAAISGILSMLGLQSKIPASPINVLADFAGGGITSAFGICVALIERKRSGKGQVIDCSMAEASSYVASWLTRSQKKPLWGKKQSYFSLLLDTGVFFYDTYETSDGRLMSVGALEPKFFKNFVQTLGLDDLKQYGGDDDESRKIVANVFKTKTQQEWTQIFEDVDACVFPVLNWQDADQHPHNMYRKAFVDKSLTDGIVVPAPAPVLSRTPGISATVKGVLGSVENNVAIMKMLQEIGYSENDVKELENDGILELAKESKM